MKQLSPEWFEIRTGKVTASRFKDVINKLKNGKSGAPRFNYKNQFIIEKLTHIKQQNFMTEAMHWGVEQEGGAAFAYEIKTNAKIKEISFIEHSTIADCGGSPDGLIDDNGCIEIKCPYNSANHLEYIKNGFPDQYKAQIQGILMLTKRQYCDFISYDPRMPEHLNLFIQRILPDQEFISYLEEEIKIFLKEINTELEFFKHYT